MKRPRYPFRRASAHALTSLAPEHAFGSKYSATADADYSEPYAGSDLVYTVDEGGMVEDAYNEPYAASSLFYAVDEGGLAAAASSGLAADQAASPDGYGYVETNEYFECEDGVRQIAEGRKRGRKLPHDFTIYFKSIFANPDQR